MPPVASIRRILTLFMMLRVFHAGEALFHTGCFIESLASQVLVIFIIRPRGNPFSSRPSIFLCMTSLAVMLIAGVVPFTPVAGLMGFVPPPPLFFLVLLMILFCYLASVEFMERFLYRRFAAP